MQDALTPMMQQYQRLRKSIPADTLLLFRLGDFYELFFEDAKEASVLLNVALTKRNEVPMCGVPYHAAPGYIAKLIKAGRRVAICDQTSEPQPGKIVSRDITQIVSSGTVSDLDLLEAKRANYVGAIYVDSGIFGFAYADLSTGEFRITQLENRQSLLDVATQTNLELVESRSVRDTTLLAALDRTATPMGGRKLRAWILQPLRNLTELQRRHQMIADLLQEPDMLVAIGGKLKSIRDIERATGRLSQASGNARDLVALKTSLQEIPALKADLQKLLDRLAFGASRVNEQDEAESLAQQLQKNIYATPDSAENMARALVDDPPLTLK